MPSCLLNGMPTSLRRHTATRQRQTHSRAAIQDSLQVFKSKLWQTHPNLVVLLLGIPVIASVLPPALGPALRPRGPDRLVSPNVSCSREIRERVMAFSG